MQIHCRTNLDLESCERWPEELPAIPRVEDYIESAHEWVYRDPHTGQPTGGKGKLELQVVGVRWKSKMRLGEYVDYPAWYCEVELHLPPHRYENLIQFYECYGRMTGKGKSAYI